MRKIILLGVCIICVGTLIPLYAQESGDLEYADIFDDFGGGKDLIFLKDLGKGIEEARKERSAVALAAYAGLLYYAERITGYKSNIVTGEQLLEEATSIINRSSKKDKKDLEMIAGVWADTYFGAGNEEKANEVLSLFTETQYVISPIQQTVKPGENITFSVFLKQGSKTTEISLLSSLVFKAEYGKFYGNEYQAPQDVKEEIRDRISVVYKDQNIGEALIVIVPEKQSPSNTSNSTEGKVKKDPIETFPKKIRSILMASEAAKVDAQDKLTQRIKLFIEELPSEFSIIKKNFTLSQGIFWAGFQIGKAYHYEDSLNVIRVEATTTPKWVVESIRRSLKRKDIEVDQSLLDRLEGRLPKKFQAEGTSELK